MFTPVKNGYGYGWRIGERIGRREMDHSGSDNGFSTYIIRFPAERLTVIVLSNSDRASSATRRRASIITSLRSTAYLRAARKIR